MKFPSIPLYSRIFQRTLARKSIPTSGTPTVKQHRSNRAYRTQVSPTCSAFLPTTYHGQNHDRMPAGERKDTNISYFYATVEKTDFHRQDLTSCDIFETRAQSVAPLMGHLHSSAFSEITSIPTAALNRTNCIKTQTHSSNLAFCIATSADWQKAEVWSTDSCSPLTCDMSIEPLASCFSFIRMWWSFYVASSNGF